jgi:AcrR family transcriptional regulator
MTPATLRADARRNRERIVAAASEVFAEQGSDACVDEIARRAGVGHATVFRRFPTKDDLIVAIFEARLEELARAVDEAAREPDAWIGLRRVVEQMAAQQVRDRGFCQAVGEEFVKPPRLKKAKAALLASFEALLRRAQEAGQVRADLEPSDVLLLVSGVGQATAWRPELPDLWRRYVGVILDGMRPGAAALEGPAPTLAPDPSR